MWATIVRLIASATEKSFNFRLVISVTIMIIIAEELIADTNSLEDKYLE